MLRFPYPALVLLTLAASATAGTTWYVDVSAVPPGVGTQAQPYTSIQYAIQQASTVDGDTLLVAPGEYNENVSTLMKNLLLISSGGPLLTTIRPVQPGNAVLLLDDADLEGFTVTGAAGRGVLVDVGNSTISRCIIRDNSGDGIGVFYDAQATQCTVTGNGTGLHTYIFGSQLGANNMIVTHNLDDLDADGDTILNVHSSVVGVADAGFWDYENRDLRLRPGSIAIDAGSPFSPPDPDGSIADAGALVYDPTYAPGPEVYCTGKLNSHGCVPAIGSIGSPSATSAAPFTITASAQVPSVPGLLFFGFAPRAAPFQGGLHCVQPPTPRVGVQFSSGSGTCGGTSAFDMNAYIQSGAHPALVAGEIVYCQWWSRDLADPAGFGSGLTDALSFGILP
jgi:hypothetical protein